MTTDAPTKKKRKKDAETEAFIGSLVCLAVAYAFCVGALNNVNPAVADANHKMMTVVRFVSGTTSQAAPAPAPKGLRIAPDGPMTGYTRAKFGPAWADIDHNGCDTRNDVLARDLKTVIKRGRCVVASGQLTDPYTQRHITFTKADASNVQIDHGPALAYVWRHGANKWPTKLRLQFANDPTILLATAGDENQMKGDDGPAEFLANRWLTDQGRCTFSKTIVNAARKYPFTVTQQDANAITAGLTKCPQPG